jgi:hypothetical protein
MEIRKWGIQDGRHDYVSLCIGIKYGVPGIIKIIKGSKKIS